MALAILRFQTSDGVKSTFQVDLGSNRFYSYAIGGEDCDRINGLKRLKNPVFTSPLIGPIPASSLGRTTLEVPSDRFGPQHRAIQITSFRTAQRTGPALSEIVTVTETEAGLPNQTTALALEVNMDRQTVETVPFQYREVPQVSSAMAFNLAGLLNTVKNVAQKAVSAVGTVASTALPAIAGAVTGAPVAPGAAPASGGGIAATIGAMLPQVAGTVGAVLPQLLGSNAVDPATGQPTSSAQITNLIASILQQIGAGAAVAPPAAGAVPAPGVAAVQPAAQFAPAAVAVAPGVASAPPPPPPPLPPSLRPSTAARPATAATRRLAMAKAFSDYDFYSDSYSDSDSDSYSGSYSASYTATAYALSDDAYSESMFLPAIGGILSAIAPALTSVLPSLLQTLGPGLMGMFSSLFQPKQTAGQMSLSLGLGGAEQEDEAALIALSLALAASSTPDLVYQRIAEVTLSFTDVMPLMIHGRSQFLYRQDQEIGFPLTIDTPRPIKKARLQLLVKDPKTLKILAEQNYQLDNLTDGPLAIVPKLSKEKLKSLKCNRDYLVCVALVWSGKDKRTGARKQIGTNTIQLITLVGEYLFDRIEGAAETVPLNNVDAFRAYWHKVWEGTFDNSIRRFTFDCKYYYALESDRTSNARMETVIQNENEGTQRSGRMKTGLIMSPYGLNDLLGQISSYSRLGEAELTALLASEFKQQFSHVARTQVEFKGRKGDAVALWVYPEFKLQRVILKQAQNTNANGHVQELREYSVYFPMPAVAHFIGVST